VPKPLLYLDIDGVLNPACPDPGPDFRTHALLGYRVLLSPRHGCWLRELSTAYELVWATTWEEDANLHIAPLLDLPALPVVRFSGYRAQPGDPRVPLMELFSARKWAPILRHAAGRPFAWLDDVIPPRLVRRSRLRRDRLLLPVHPAEGLSRRHVERLLARPPAAGLLGRAQSSSARIR
jgi:hypothetical protein